MTRYAWQAGLHRARWKLALFATLSLIGGCGSIAGHEPPGLKDTDGNGVEGVSSADVNASAGGSHRAPADSSGTAPLAGPVFGPCCATPSDDFGRAVPGCEDGAVEACVCAAIPGCCDVAWGTPCVLQAAIGCGACAELRVDDLLLLAAVLDSDGDGNSDLIEFFNGGDPFDPHDGPDIDGDGIPNGQDDDVDGDGLANGDDPDIDGDGVPNGDDADMDADGEDNDTDRDDDGDGIPDRDDEDDDADGEPDCPCKHGVCSGVLGQCSCEPGWKGESCDEFHCRDIRNCNNGTCIGPNTCGCNRGWESVGSIPCAVFHCRGVRNCSGHGQCVGPDACECDAGWLGSPDCSRPTCVASPSTCNDHDPCTLDECNPINGCTHSPWQCPGSQVCVNGDCTDRCNWAGDCSSDQGCRDGGCFECGSDLECSDGNPCTSDECSSGRCLNFGCEVGTSCVLGKCVAACSDGQCDEGEVCKLDGCFASCTGDSCDDGEECHQNACRPKQCESDGSCGDEEECIDGVCKSDEDD